MPEIVLPPRYYLDHFEELVRDTKNLHSHLFEKIHFDYLADYQTLQEDSRCLLIRMINRTGRIFSRDDLVYAEISDHEKAWRELSEKSFVRKLIEEDRSDFINWLRKEELQNILLKAEIPYKKSASKNDLIQIVSSANVSLDSLFFNHEQIFVLSRHTDIEYLLFLYFGKIQNKLILPTLRDLGIRASNKKARLETKFKTIDQAKSHYFYSQLKHHYKKTPLPDECSHIELWPPSTLIETTLLREELLLKVSDAAKKSGDLQRALDVLKVATEYPATIHRARLLHQLEYKEECLKELERMMDSPLSDEELLFADDFLQRKFQKKKLSHLTETLRNAEKVFIDESFYRHPEFGVIEGLKEQGQNGFFAENRLWTGLFWTFFQEELESSSHSEFDHAPSELMEKTFLEKFKDQIARKISETTMDDFKAWFAEDEMTLFFLDHVSLEQIYSMLTYMAEDYYQRSSGYPDIMTVRDGKLAFIEVKAEGDSLKPSQIKQMRQLEKTGFAVQILQVGYQYNENQTYVVVDLETTGSISSWNRITEIGAVKVKNGVVIDRYQTLINPERSIPFNIQQLTGITNEMVKDAPLFPEVAEAFKEFVQGSILVAHNAGFDYGFLQNEYQRLEETFIMPYICTKSWMRKHYPGLEAYGLKSLCQNFSIGLTQHHRALCDAEAAAGLLNLINEKRRMTTLSP